MSDSGGLLASARASGPGAAPGAIVLTAEQRAAVEFGPAPLLVVAGAGTGKTTVMAERIVHLVDAGTCTPDQVLGLTFTNKAAAHLRREVTRRLGPDADVTVSTYHAFGAGLVAGHALALDLDPGTQVLNRAQAWQLLFAVFDEFRFERRRTFRPGAVVDHALELASRCSDHLVAVEAVEADCDEVANAARWKTARETALSRRELCQVVARYVRRKQERNLLDYGDQVALAVRLLAEHADVAAGLRAQHPVVLLDEYQDTNYAQRRLLQLLYPPGSAITAVGDDMQSIYAFRGAHLGNILGFGRHFPPVTAKPLQINRRSGAELVALANRIQAEVSRTLEKTLEARPGAPATTIDCFLAADDAEEAAEIARDIAARGQPWSDHAVLCRKRRLIPAIVDALEARDVPVDVIGSGGLLERPEVVDLVAWLETLADLGSTVALLRILEGPRYRIGRRDLAALARHARRLSEARDEGERVADLADTLEDLDAVADLSAAARGRLAELRAERRALSAAAARLSVLDLAEAVILRTGLWSASGDKGRENLLRFLDLAARFAPVEGDPGLPAFVEYLHLLDETEEDLAEAHPSGLDAVQVMTVHQAKGLEFPNVWVPGLAGGEGRGQGIFPDSRAGENPVSQSSALPWWLRPDDDGMPHWRSVARLSDLDDEVRRRRHDEEWRLFYVACTRARSLLVCSAAHWYPGPAEPQGPSELYRFVAAQTDLVTERFRHDPPATDPEVAAKERRRQASARRYAAPAVARDQPASLFDDASLPPATTVPSRSAPAALSVTNLVSYARCPRQFYWSVVRPLPRRASAAARQGREVHRWIELRAGRQLALLEPEPEAENDPGAGDPGGPGGPTPLAGLRASFLAGPFADLDPVRVEAPFELAVGGRLVRGRVDAVYERDGRVELVDFKTGRRPAVGDAGAKVQLELYAVAAVDTWRADPDRLRTTYCYLRGDGGQAELESADWDGGGLAEVRDRLGATLDALGAERWRTTVGAWCGRCDFVDFCAEGRKAVDRAGRGS